MRQTTWSIHPMRRRLQQVYLCPTTPCLAAVSMQHSWSWRVSYAGLWRAEPEPRVNWTALAEHGCLVREHVCVDQGRFVAFDERLQPGARFEHGGQLFSHAAFHNLPGYPDNVKVGCCTPLVPMHAHLPLHGRLCMHACDACRTAAQRGTDTTVHVAR
jgi:hypothetical protein